MVQCWIIHADLDAFFASVEQLLDPSLRGKPLIVGGDPRHRGVVASASYPARAYGVRSAMPVAQALRLCPQVIVVPPRRKVYARFFFRIMNILEDITLMVEKLSIDEAFLDVSACMGRWESAETLGRHIQTRVAEQENLPISLGIATSKLVAKFDTLCDHTVIDTQSIKSPVVRASHGDSWLSSLAMSEPFSPHWPSKISGA